MVLRFVFYYFLLEGSDRHKDIRSKRNVIAPLVVLSFTVINESVYWLHANNGLLFLWYAISAVLLGAFVLYYQVINIRNFSTITKEVLKRPQLFGSTTMKIVLGAWFGVLSLIGLFLLYSAVVASLVWWNPNLN